MNSLNGKPLSIWTELPPSTSSFCFVEAARYCKSGIPVWTYLEHKSQYSRKKKQQK